MIMARQRLKLGTVAMLLVLALAAMGSGYALWSKVLKIEGTINTGKVDARWSGVICSEFHPWPFSPAILPGEVDGKDVGRTTWALDPNDDQILIITIENSYPSYSVDCQVEFVNDGSVPVIIRGNDITPVTPNLHNCVLSGTQTKTLSCDELTVVFVDGIGSQVDPGDGVASSFRLHVEQPAEQGAEYEIQVRICMAQWNEFATFGDCVAAAPVHNSGGG